MARKRFNAREVIAVLIQQGSRIPCGCAAMPPSFPKCGLFLDDPNDTIGEHLDPLGPGMKWGADSVANYAYFRKACADLKTYGTKATSAGSDTHKRAKHHRMTTPKKRKSRPISKRKQPWPSRSFRRPR